MPHSYTFINYIYSTADKQTFPELDVVGWYRTGSLPAASDLEVQKGLSFLNEAPVFLLLDARGKIEEEDTVMTHQGFRQRGPDLPVLLLESGMLVVEVVLASCVDCLWIL